MLDVIIISQQLAILPCWDLITSQRIKSAGKQLIMNYYCIGYIYWSYGSTNAWVWSWDRQVSSKSSDKSTENWLSHWSICNQGIELLLILHISSFKLCWFFDILKDNSCKRWEAGDYWAYWCQDKRTERYIGGNKCSYLIILSLLASQQKTNVQPHALPPSNQQNWKRK